MVIIYFLRMINISQLVKRVYRKIQLLTIKVANGPLLAVTNLTQHLVIMLDPLSVAYYLNGCDYLMNMEICLQFVVIGLVAAACTRIQVGSTNSFASK